MAPVTLPPTTRLVLLDIDGTLVDHASAAEETTWRWASTFPGWDLDREGTAALWERLDRLHFGRYQAGELSFEGQLRARVRDFVPGAAGTSDAEADALMGQYRTIYEQVWSAYEDAPRLVARLREAGLAVAYLTNGDVTRQTTKLAATGVLVEGWPVLASRQLGATKPDRAAFHAACEQMGVRPREAVMVGDDVGADVDGALGAGLGAVWVRRPDWNARGQWGEVAPREPVPTVATLDDLLLG